MPEELETRMALSQYRLKKAKDTLDTARQLLDSEKYADANNRAYYAIFHSLRSVLAMDNFDSKKHSGVIGKFRELYVKTGIFSAEISGMIGDAFLLRSESDYEDMFVPDMEETEEAVSNAQIVVEAVERYLKALNQKE